MNIRLRQEDYDDLDPKDPSTVYQIDPTAKPLRRDPRTGKPIHPGDAARSPDARYRYHSSIHTEPARTLRIDTDGLDAAVYVDLLRLILDRWPRTKLAGGGIVVPEDTPPGPVSITAPLPDGERPGTRAYWAGDEHQQLRDTLAAATGLEPLDIAEKLAFLGKHHRTTTATIAAYIRDQELKKP